MTARNQKPELPTFYTVPDLQEMVRQLDVAVGALESAISELSDNEIEGAYFRLDSLKNNFLQKVVDSAEDAHTLAKREVTAKKNGIPSGRTESALKHYKAELKKWEAAQKAETTEPKPGRKKGA